MSAPIRTYRIAAIPGDGIGIEVVAAALDVVKAAIKTSGIFQITITTSWGTAYFKESGLYLPSDFLMTLKAVWGLV